MVQVKYAIITMTDDEYMAIQQRFDPRPYTGSSGRAYGLANIRSTSGKNFTVVIKQSNQGNDASQQIAHDLIEDWHPQLLLVVGTAGGVPDNDFTLGDVIVSDYIANLNVSKRFEDGSEAFNMGGGIDPGINDIANSLLLYKEQLIGWNAEDSIGMKRPTVDLRLFDMDEFRSKMAPGAKNASWYEKLHTSITSQFGSEKNRSRRPLFKAGTIASSNSLIRNVDILVQWLQNRYSTRAVEMETAGVYQAAHRIRQQYPVMAIRGISDIIGLERDDQWKKYACETAAAFAYAFIRADIFKPPPGTIVEPVEVFISYSEEDAQFKKSFEEEIKLLREKNVIRLWNSQQIESGWERKQDILNRINSAHIIIPLISQSYVDAYQLHKEDMQDAIERHVSGEAHVLPIMLQPVNLNGTPFEGMNTLPANGRAIKYPANYTAWRNIVQGIRALCMEIQEGQRM